MKGEYITEVFTENTGGGLMCDFVRLKNGKIIAISDECIAIYESLDSFYEGTGEEPCLWFADMDKSK
jgi:hypothetical protein